MDNFRNTSEEYYADLRKGKADINDFERYIYGGSQNKHKDRRDEYEEENRKSLL